MLPHLPLPPNPSRSPSNFLQPHLTTPITNPLPLKPPCFPHMHPTRRVSRAPPPHRRLRRHHPGDRRRAHRLGRRRRPVAAQVDDRRAPPGAIVAGPAVVHDEGQRHRVRAAVPYPGDAGDVAGLVAGDRFDYCGYDVVVADAVGGGGAG